jgi:hypothetical protein
VTCMLAWKPASISHVTVNYKRRGIHSAKPKFRKIKFIDKDINHTNRIVLVDPIFQTFRKQRRLSPIHPINEALHPIPRESPGNLIF